MYALQDNLQNIKILLSDVGSFELKNLNTHSEGIEYGACHFELNDLKIEYRVSKITPTKTGQFVTIWKRNTQGITAPFDVADAIDFVIITSKNGDNWGQFVFPKMVLVEKGIFSQNEKGGKRGIRVYPPWDKAMNKQAEKTQNWQLKYFFTADNFINSEIFC